MACIMLYPEIPHISGFCALVLQMSRGFARLMWNQSFDLASGTPRVLSPHPAIYLGFAVRFLKNIVYVYARHINLVVSFCPSSTRRRLVGLRYRIIVITEPVSTGGQTHIYFPMRVFFLRSGKLHSNVI